MPRQFIDELLSRVDIVDVVDEYVPLRKGGKDHKACCPFHNEKTPSFTVSADKQFYHCFGCGAHGTAIGFLMDYAHMDFIEAVEDLASRAGLEVPREAGGEQGESLQPLLDMLARASAYYQQQLRQHREAARAVDYLRSRGLSGEIAAAFGLGFAPPGWDNLLGALGGRDAERTLMARAGLLVEKSGGGYYDRFRDRITFPILDRRGRTVGFGARVLGDDTPKYLNSPETPVFHKGRELYGLYQARKAAGHPQRLIVVEGYMDVVALAQHGIRNAVATLGTAATEAHLEQLFRVSQDVVFCFDGDEAGRRAAWRALETALPAMHDGRQALFMFLPEGQDPDSLVRTEGPEAFAAAVEAADSLGTFLFDRLAARVDRSTIDGRARLAELARPLLAKLPEGSFRELCYRRLAELTGLAPENSATLGSGRGNARARSPASPLDKQKRQSPSLVRKVITWLLHYPSLGQGVTSTDHLRSLELPGVPLLLELVETLEDRPNLTTGGLLERFRDHASGRHLARLAAEEVAPLDAGLEREFSDSLEKLHRLADDQRFALLARKGREGHLSDAEKREFARLSGGAGQDGGGGNATLDPG
ncbi:MAG: DNA primase [Gammaproteobacteria bacterium]|nr:DNA primase [Gammaproteobacteria bacterium]NIM72515.1 DNA primase [Gammaproteobacteria bacterium]NIO24274.1 DNA primase [Gammaproteobacteria bacterium]NIO64879.1 DNA primase [Gammaproteobacteria bacterium]NIP44926.1 DNA primase [Gammaproteobacteria bacterium]